MHRAVLGVLALAATAAGILASVAAVLRDDSTALTDAATIVEAEPSPLATVVMGLLPNNVPYTYFVQFALDGAFEQLYWEQVNCYVLLASTGASVAYNSSWSVSFHVGSRDLPDSHRIDLGQLEVEADVSSFTFTLPVSVNEWWTHHMYLGITTFIPAPAPGAADCIVTCRPRPLTTVASPYVPVQPIVSGHRTGNVSRLEAAAATTNTTAANIYMSTDEVYEFPVLPCGTGTSLVYRLPRQPAGMHYAMNITTSTSSAVFECGTYGTLLFDDVPTDGQPWTMVSGEHVVWQTGTLRAFLRCWCTDAVSQAADVLVSIATGVSALVPRACEGTYWACITRAGCAWNTAYQRCVPSTCSTIESPLECMSMERRCSWTGSRCVPPQCTQMNTETQCTGEYCEWQRDLQCRLPHALPCGTWTNSTECGATEGGCEWSYDAYVAWPVCVVATRAGAVECSMTNGPVCTGSGTCRWNEEFALCVPDTCYYSTAELCTQDSSCRWASADGFVAPACIDVVQSCTLGGCTDAWCYRAAPDSCVDAAPCTLYTNEPSCVNQAECAWLPPNACERRTSTTTITTTTTTASVTCGSIPDELQCSEQSVCMWDDTTTVCVSNQCSLLSDETLCNATPGCVYAASYLSDTHTGLMTCMSVDSCYRYRSASCPSPCQVYLYSSPNIHGCYASAPCGQQSTVHECDLLQGCVWRYDDVVWNDYVCMRHTDTTTAAPTTTTTTTTTAAFDGCDSIDSQTLCQWQSGCEWDGYRTVCEDALCSASFNQQTCTETPGCVYDRWYENDEVFGLMRCMRADACNQYRSNECVAPCAVYAANNQGTLGCYASAPCGTRTTLEECAVFAECVWRYDESYHTEICTWGGAPSVATTTTTTTHSIGTTTTAAVNLAFCLAASADECLATVGCHMSQTYGRCIDDVVLATNCVVRAEQQCTTPCVWDTATSVCSDARVGYACGLSLSSQVCQSHAPMCTWTANACIATGTLVTMREDTSSQAAPTTTTTTAAAAAAEPALQALPKAHVNAVTVTALSLTLATMAVMLLFCLRR